MELRSPLTAGAGPSTPYRATLSPATSPGVSPGRSHVHGEYEARLYSPGSGDVSAAASGSTPTRDLYGMRTPPRRFADDYLCIHIASVAARRLPSQCHDGGSLRGGRAARVGFFGTVVGVEVPDRRVAAVWVVCHLCSVHPHAVALRVLVVGPAAVWAL
jgi:hypothetical protein